jgi:hypothetical protein
METDKYMLLSRTLEKGKLAAKKRYLLVTFQIIMIVIQINSLICYCKAILSREEKR